MVRNGILGIVVSPYGTGFTGIQSAESQQPYAPRLAGSRGGRPLLAGHSVCCRGGPRSLRSSWPAGLSAELVGGRSSRTAMAEPQPAPSGLTDEAAISCCSDPDPSTKVGDRACFSDCRSGPGTKAGQARAESQLSPAAAAGEPA